MSEPKLFATGTSKCLFEPPLPCNDKKFSYEANNLGVVMDKSNVEQIDLSIKIREIIRKYNPSDLDFIGDNYSNELSCVPLTSYLEKDTECKAVQIKDAI